MQETSKAPEEMTAKKVPLKRCAPEAQPEAWGAALCEWLSLGQTMASFCRQQGRPTYSTIYAALNNDRELAARVAHARDVGYDAIADNCFGIADDGSGDTWIDDNGNERVNSDHIQRSKLRIETRLKLLACWNPKKYGNKQEVEHKGQMTVVLSKDDAGLL